MTLPVTICSFRLGGGLRPVAAIVMIMLNTTTPMSSIYWFGIRRLRLVQSS